MTEDYHLTDVDVIWSSTVGQRPGMRILSKSLQLRYIDRIFMEW